MTEAASYHVKPALADGAHVNQDRFRLMTAHAARDPDSYWAEECRRIDWMRAPTVIKNTSFDLPVSIRWFEDGTLNASANCLDRHLARNGDRTAILWQGDDPADMRSISYRDLHTMVCKFANAMLGLGVGRGDVVTIYMPMVIEAAAAMLACARIGAIHSVVFGGFSAESLAGRIQDCGSRLLITADESRRGGRRMALKANADVALAQCPSVQAVIVASVTGGAVMMQPGRDHRLDDLLAEASADCPPAEMPAEAPLFILYTSGSTGKPKGVLHTTGGYMVWASYTHEIVFDYRPGEVFWCTADIGWVTGHTYVVYGPLANGGTTLMFEGVPTWPDSGRLWQEVDRHQVNIFYTAPTAIRALMRDGEAPVRRASRASLRVLGSVGEPINPEAWLWYYHVVGDERCPVVDTWWQTETGGILIAPLPGAIAQKPGSATLPLPGVKPVIVDAEGNALEGACEGNLCLSDSWPGQMRSLYGDHARFEQAYFTTFPGRYCTGDGARRDADGYYWITGRVDDVINVSGHRMGTAEVEAALASHAQVAEAAVVGIPHALKGQGIHAYVTLVAGVAPGEALRKELANWVRVQIGPIATPDVLQFAPGLPKTRSGKIMRRILRKLAAGETEGLGDISTLADPSVVDELIAGRPPSGRG